ncbi:hypothetical protein Y1Q_0004134 [Alligator mississippiensis]|uniref:Uncharacterized protein n=1 Tax=Alligator mississippiensis TaxID=8496 RepID=A0A151PI33_ALLMI|nr:hypothetical protein Y1Q_0004134 [Alligator mississippiensis]
MAETLTVKGVILSCIIDTTTDFNILTLPDCLIWLSSFLEGQTGKTRIPDDDPNLNRSISPYLQMSALCVCGSFCSY